MTILVGGNPPESKLHHCVIVHRDGEGPLFWDSEHGVMCSLDGYYICPLEKLPAGFDINVDEKLNQIKQRAQESSATVSCPPTDQ